MNAMIFFSQIITESCILITIIVTKKNFAFTDVKLSSAE